jgi:hypothetical protein
MDDIGDSTYVRSGKTRIPFSGNEEYCGDNRVSAESLGKATARKASRDFY